MMNKTGTQIKYILKNKSRGQDNANFSKILQVVLLLMVTSEFLKIFNDKREELFWICPVKPVLPWYQNQIKGNTVKSI